MQNTLKNITRGTTPVITVSIDDSLEQAETIQLTIKQRSKKLVKEKSDLQIMDKTVSYHFTQAETLELSADFPAQLQIRWVKDGEAYATNIVTFSVSDLLQDGVI